MFSSLSQYQVGKAGSKNKIFTTNISPLLLLAGLEGAAYVGTQIATAAQCIYNFYTWVGLLLSLKILKVKMNLHLNLITVLISTIFIRISGKYYLGTLHSWLKMEKQHNKYLYNMRKYVMGRMRSYVNVLHNNIICFKLHDFSINIKIMQVFIWMS